MLQRAQIASVVEELTHDVLSEAYIDARNYYFSRRVDSDDETTIAKMVQILMGRLKPGESERATIQKVVEKFVGGIQTYPSPVADVKEDADYDLATMKRNEFAKEITKLGCTNTGKDGQNHAIYRNPSTGKTTSLGIGGHGDGVSQDAGVLKTYLKQLGITPTQWNKR